LQSRGLRIQDPTGDKILPIPVVDHPAKLDWRHGDIALVTVKSQHTPDVLTELAASAPPYLPVVCLQNGVRNEPEAMRRFANVYGVPVACPTAHLEPGVVQAFSTPVTGILDVGRYPAGLDDTAVQIAAAFTASTFDARPIGDLPRWKWRKLVTNLGNAVEAVCGPAARQGTITEQAMAEGEACLAAARIEAASKDEDLARRAHLLTLGPVLGKARPGGSSWQSLARRAPGVETVYLNGEIVLLGRLHEVATPVNTLLQRLVTRLAAIGGAPGSLTLEEFTKLADRQLTADDE
jgi:2-dehydropantoate 2-reductase